MASGDLSLPVAHGVHPAAPSPWRVEQQPSTFIALWPGDAPPTMMEVIAALAQRCDRPPAHLQDMPAREDVAWAAAFETSLSELPIIIWSEAARPLPEGELDDRRAYACRWVVGFEAMLSPARPYEEYVAIVTTMAASLEPVAIFDAVTWLWMEREALEDLTHDPPGLPAIDSLWVIHDVGAKGDQGQRWLHTHGLWRCGRPELEMLEVPAEKTPLAARLLSDIARRVLDDGDALPAALEPLILGPEINVTLHPWQSLMPQLAKGSSGGPDDRDEENDPHAGVRAVVCGPKQRGVFRKQWAWPSEALALIEQDRGVIFRSDRDTQRAAELVRARWGDLATAFAAFQRLAPSDGQPRANFLIKARFSDPRDRECSEHMWVLVRGFKGDTVEGELVNQPLQVTGVQRGQIVTIRRDDVSDWQVANPSGSFAPSDIPALWRVLDAMKDPARSSPESLHRRAYKRAGLPQGAAESKTS